MQGTEEYVNEWLGAAGMLAGEGTRHNDALHRQVSNCQGQRTFGSSALSVL